MSLTPYIRIAPIPAALQAGQWTVLLIDPPPVSDELLFKKNDQVYIRSVSKASSVAPYTWKNNIYDTEYIISKFGQRQTRSLRTTSAATNLFVPNLSLSPIPNGAMYRERYTQNEEAFLTEDFKWISQGTTIVVKKGTHATILVGPLTKKGSQSPDPEKWGYRIRYAIYNMEEAVVCYPVAIRAHMLSPHAIAQPSGRAGLR